MIYGSFTVNFFHIPGVTETTFSLRQSLVFRNIFIPEITSLINNQTHENSLLLSSPHRTNKIAHRDSYC